MDAICTVRGFEDELDLSVNMYFELKTFINKTKHRKVPKSYELADRSTKNKK